MDHLDRVRDGRLESRQLRARARDVEKDDAPDLPGIHEELGQQRQLLLGDGDDRHSGILNHKLHSLLSERVVDGNGDLVLGLHGKAVELQVAAVLPVKTGASLSLQPGELLSDAAAQLDHERVKLLVGKVLVVAERSVLFHDTLAQTSAIPVFLIRVLQHFTTQ